MTRYQREAIESWSSVVRYAIRVGNDDAAYRLTVGFVRRLRELWLEEYPA